MRGYGGRQEGGAGERNEGCNQSRWGNRNNNKGQIIRTGSWSPPRVENRRQANESKDEAVGSERETQEETPEQNGKEKKRKKEGYFFGKQKGQLGKVVYGNVRRGAKRHPKVFAFACNRKNESKKDDDNKKPKRCFVLDIDIHVWAEVVVVQVLLFISCQLPIVYACALRRRWDCDRPRWGGYALQE